jgi:hypothetical protein
MVSSSTDDADSNQAEDDVKESDNFKAVLRGKTLTITPGKRCKIGDRDHPVTDDVYGTARYDRYSLAHQLLMCCMDGLSLGADTIICTYGLSERGRELNDNDYSVWQRAGDEAGFTWGRLSQEMCPYANREDRPLARRVIACISNLHRENTIKPLEEVPIEVADAVPGVGTDVHGDGDDNPW